MDIRKGSILIFVLWMTFIPVLGGFFYQDEGNRNSLNYNDRVYVYDRATDRILKLTPKEFIIGAIGVEMPATYNYDALVAQGIAAHTYLRYSQLCGTTTPKGGFMEVDTDRFIGYTDKKHLKEAYGSAYPDVYPLLVDAAEEAQKYVITYAGQPILAAYHAISNGRTQGAEDVWQQELPYLQPVDSVWDRKVQGYESVVTLSTAALRGRIQQLLPEADLTQQPKNWIRIISRSGSGYISKVEIGGILTDGRMLREILCARSADIEISYTDSGQFVFSVRGYGHGVGMSQVGAEHLASLGKKYDEILKHYYTDVEIHSIN